MGVLVTRLTVSVGVSAASARLAIGILTAAGAAGTLSSAVVRVQRLFVRCSIACLTLVMLCNFLVSSRWIPVRCMTIVAHHIVYQKFVDVSRLCGTQSITTNLGDTECN